MRTISCKLEDLKTMTLHIGYEGENDYTSVRIDAGSVFAQYPEAVPSLKVQPPKGNMYPVIVTRDGDIVIWNVSDSDTASNGNGEIQLTFTENTVVVKSCTGKTLVHRSLKSTGPAPDPLIDFIDMAEEVVGEAKDAAEAAEAAAQHAPMIGLDGYWYKWDAETEGYVKTDTKARGEDGANGVGITSVEKISTVGLVDTYRINFTNGTNTTYTVTNGQDGSVPIDDTTPAANKVFSSAKVDEELTGVKNAIDGIDDDIHTYEYLPIPKEETISTANLQMEEGYIAHNGSTGGTTTYKHTKKIHVTQGDVVKYILDVNGYILNIRFVCAYNGETIVTDKGQADTGKSYTVPEGITDIVLSIQNTDIYDGASLHRYYTVQGEKTKVFDVGEYVKNISKVKNIITEEKDELSANTVYVLESNIDNRKNENIDLWCEFDSFDTITVGHGSGTYGGYVVVDEEYVKVYYDGTVYKTFTHGLTISDFIGIHVTQGDLAIAYFVITTSSGQWKSSESALWHGCKGDIYCSATMGISNIRFSTAYPDMMKDVFIFGDSYTTMGDTSRWPYYIKTIYGASNFAIFGWGGEGSADALICFNKVMNMVKPKVVAWFIGMNDGDSSSEINSTWEETAEEVASFCKTNGIKLVLATIPNTPTVRNTYKNAYVKESGLDYVDFAKAVNAESAGATWYTDMLSNDNVHPTALGGKALASRLIADLPQIV